MNDFKPLSDIIGISARAITTVEEGQVECLIEGTSVSFTIHEHSNGITKLFLDDNIPKIRKLLKSYGVLFAVSSDEIISKPFIEYIKIIYGWSNTRGNALGNWQIK